MNNMLVLLAAASLALASPLAEAVSVAAQEKTVFGNDANLPIEPYGFGTVKKTIQLDPNILGTEGQGDYTLYHQRFSLIKPDQEIHGLWTVFRVTQVMCRSLFRGEKSLVEAAPKGFVIERPDLHSLGFKGEAWDGRWFAVTRTGDSELDATGGHPFWYVKYSEDGNLRSCGVELGSNFEKLEGAYEAHDIEAKRSSFVQFLYVGVPQIFFGIITEPAHAGVHPLNPADAIDMVSPCGSAWCRIESAYNITPGQWYVRATIWFGDPMRLE